MEIPIYNIDSAHPLNWIQRKYLLELPLKLYMHQQLCIFAREGYLQIASENGENYFEFTNGHISGMLDMIVKRWRQQGCTIINLPQYIGWIYQEVATEFLAALKTEV